MPARMSPSRDTFCQYSSAIDICEGNSRSLAVELDLEFNLKKVLSKLNQIVSNFLFESNEIYCNFFCLGIFFGGEGVGGG